MATRGQTLKDMKGLGGNLLCPPSLNRASLPHANLLSRFYIHFIFLLAHFPGNPAHLSMDKPRCAPGPPFSQGITIPAHLQGAPSPRPALGVPGGCSERPQRDPHRSGPARGCGRMPALPGSRTPAGPGGGPRWPRGCGTRRSSRAFPPEGAQRTRIVGAAGRTRHSPGRQTGTATPPCASQMPRNLLPAAAQPGEKPRVSVPPWAIPVPGGCTPCQSSPPAQAPVQGI